MDPALHELIHRAGPGESVEVALRLGSSAVLPPGIEIISRFGDVATARVPRELVRRTWALDGVYSMKAPRPLAAGSEPVTGARSVVIGDSAAADPDAGRGVVVGVIDVGFDLGHPEFVDRQGRSRIRAVWDQSEDESVQPYGYGATRDQRIGRVGVGDHGTSVASVAAGTRLGVAPGAELVVVNVAASDYRGAANLGDSVRLLEAIDFVRRTAAGRPCVINLSLGATGGPHDGSALADRAVDALVEERNGTAVVCSAGNYGELGVHQAGCLVPGAEHTIVWSVSEGDSTPNELEVWYPRRDRLNCSVISPTGRTTPLRPGEARPVVEGRTLVGRAYHRRNEPNSGDHHIDVFLEAGAPSGRWKVALCADDVIDGRFQVSVERDAATGQSRLEAPDSEGTLGTLACGGRIISVGALGSAGRAGFSSTGPTRDGRSKPDVWVDGTDVLVATCDGYGTKSGTSFAAPRVAGRIASRLAIQPEMTIAGIHRVAREPDLPRLAVGVGVPT